ncbi:hypothetical protein QTN47_11170 [Danxiaibacter flavus]|uniref:Uncharacterized protein n=1 Tax=Danxiaibacter flavus TaxID=3049108 RepID=A0ABV3ZDV1_9BACT|nr:hypothetical protein QNM32_11175 [Chitinophagaceae bacterium DXS]
METNSNNQEILLITASHFSRLQLCDKNFSVNNDIFSNADKLEEACWNGLLNDMLPEIIEKSSDGKRLPLAQIWQGVSFLQIELKETYDLVEMESSINPYFFMHVINYN